MITLVIHQIILLQKIGRFCAKLAKRPLKFRLKIVGDKIRPKEIISVFRHVLSIKTEKQFWQISTSNSNRGFSMTLFRLVFLFLATNRHKNKGEQNTE